jgi:hypothetical protein
MKSWPGWTAVVPCIMAEYFFMLQPTNKAASSSDNTEVIAGELPNAFSHANAFDTSLERNFFITFHLIS